MSEVEGRRGMTIFKSVAPRSDEDVSALYVEARCAGVEVSHYPERKCSTFEGHPKPGCELGVFRSIGTIIFYKDERRWEARARADVGATELATLISWALELNGRYGRSPGHATRKRIFTHAVSKRTGKRVAYTEVCYALGVADVLATTTAAEVNVEELVSNLLTNCST